jgi:hypothetical protein
MHSSLTYSFLQALTAPVPQRGAFGPAGSVPAGVQALGQGQDPNGPPPFLRGGSDAGATVGAPFSDLGVLAQGTPGAPGGQPGAFSQGPPGGPTNIGRPRPRSFRHKRQAPVVNATTRVVVKSVPGTATRTVLKTVDASGAPFTRSTVTFSQNAGITRTQTRQVFAAPPP